MTATADLEPLRAAALPGDLSQEERDRRWSLVLPHAERLRRIAVRRLASPDEADDVVQEAMLRAVTFEQLDESYAGQFLTAVTVRLCADVHRDRDRQLRIGVRDAVRTVPSNDPHEDLLDTAEARWLYGECLKLPGRERAVVLARARGMSVREAAGTLGVGVKSAEAALTKARHRMRRVVQAAGAVLVTFLAKARRVSAPAVVTTSMSVLFVGVMHVGTPHTPDVDQVHQAPDRSASVSVAPPAPAQPPVRAASARATARLRGDDPPPSDPSASNGGGNHVKHGHGAPVDPMSSNQGQQLRVDPRDSDESYVDAVERCVSKGVTLTPGGVGCNHVMVVSALAGS